MNTTTSRATPLLRTPVIVCSDPVRSRARASHRVGVSGARTRRPPSYQQGTAWAGRRASAPSVGIRREELVGRGVRVGAAGHHQLGELVELGAGVHVPPALAECGHGDRLDLLARPAYPPRLELAGGAQVREVRIEGGDDVVD